MNQQLQIGTYTMDTLTNKKITASSQGVSTDLENISWYMYMADNHDNVPISNGTIGFIVNNTIKDGYVKFASSQYGGYSVHENELIPIDDISDFVFNKQNNELKEEDVSNIFEYGVYISNLINKSQKSADKNNIYIYLAPSHGSSYSIWNALVNKCDEDIQCAFAVFGINDSKQSQSVIKHVGKYMHTFVTFVENCNGTTVLWGICGIKIQNFPFINKIVDARDKNRTHIIVKDALIHNIEYNFDGNNEYIKLKSTICKLEQKQQAVQNELKWMNNAFGSFKKILKAKYFHDLDIKCADLFSDFTIRGGLSNESYFRYNYAKQYSPDGNDVIEVTIPHINKFISDYKNKKDDSILFEYIKTKEIELQEKASYGGYLPLSQETRDKTFHNINTMPSTLYQRLQNDYQTHSDDELVLAYYDRYGEIPGADLFLPRDATKKKKNTTSADVFTFDVSHYVENDMIGGSSESKPCLTGGYTLY